MKLFLSGGGNAEKTRKLDRLFLSQISKGRILYIPVAMPETSHSFGECYDWIRKTLRPLSHRIDMWTELGERDFGALRKYCAVYIGGGNTFSLLDKIRNSGFESLLEKHIEIGGIVYGGSAGAIILGKDIRTATIGKAADKNRVGLKQFSGLGLLGKYSVHCHYTPEDDCKIMKLSTPVIALAEDCGAYVNDRKISVIGTDAYVFDNGRRTVLEAGDSITT